MGNNISKGCQCISAKNQGNAKNSKEKQPICRREASGIKYTSHHTQTSHWVPPKENWESTNDNGLPYAHEHALDKSNRTYYINHQYQSTQREDPVEEKEEDPPPEPRDVELSRAPQMGFGFVAGSERPVIVRFVTEGGPSESKLLPGDRILQINGENVEKAARERVIELVRNCDDTILLTVCQPYSENSGRKSALLTAAKKARLKNNPSRVRFADAVTVNGTSVISPSTHESYIPFMPNVLKVFLENGQTKSFKYDSKTTVREVMDSLEEKLNIKCTEHFALVLQNMKSPTQGRMTFLQQHENLGQIAAKPGSQHFKCLFRLTFVPRDSYDLVRRDPNAFEYFYLQCTNDVVHERYAQELKYDLALRLASLHIQEHCISNNMSKVSLKVIEKETGLDKFLPESLLESMKIKDVRKMLTHFMKANQNLALPGQKQLTALQTKMHYLKILSEVRSFGGKCFLVTLVEKKAEVMISVGPKQGISLVTNIKNNILAPLAHFDQIQYMTIEKEERETVKRIVLHLANVEMETMGLVMLNEEVTDFVCLIEGYYSVYVDKNKPLLVDRDQSSPELLEVPPYHGKHNVSPASWSYPKGTDQSSKKADTAEEGKTQRNKNSKEVDLSQGTPPYHPTKEYLDNLKKDFKLQVDKNSINKPAKVNAPLASPDFSNLSNSSESSVQTPTQPNIPSDNDTTSQNTVTDNKATVNENGLYDNDNEELSETEGDSSELNSTLNSTVSSSLSDSMKQSIVIAENHISEPLCNGLSEEKEDTGSNKPINQLFDSHIKTKLPHNASKLLPDKATVGKLSKTDSDVKTGESVVLRNHEDRPSRVVRSTEMISPGEVPPHTVVLRPKSENTTRRERPGSFGLHSPDKVPQTEEELQQLTKEYEEQQKSDRTSTASDVHPSYNPKLFCDGGLYLDPDIIDLTFLPPPLKDSNPDEKLIDFTSPEMTSPPPGFDDISVSSLDKSHDTSTESGNSIPMELSDLPVNIKDRIDAMVANDMELGTQLSAIDALLLDELVLDEAEKESGIDSESDSGTEINEYSAKTPTCPNDVIRRKKKKVNPREVFSQLAKRQSYQHVDFGADDIDAFIASVTVPPPPKDDLEGFNVPPLNEMPKPKLSLSTPDKSSRNVAHKVILFSDKSQDKSSNYHKGGKETDMSAENDGISNYFAKRDMNIASLEEDINKLILPPPATASTEINLDEIMIVPPVSADLDAIGTPKSGTKKDIDSKMSRDIKHTVSVLEQKLTGAKQKPVSSRKPTPKKIEITEIDNSKTGKFVQRSASHDHSVSDTRKSSTENCGNIKENLVKQLSATVQEKIDSKEQPNFILRDKNSVKTRSSNSPTRSSSSGSPNSPRRSRPVQPPPPPPTGQKILNKRSVSVAEPVTLPGKDKIPPPAPPKRFSSLDNSPVQPTLAEPKTVLIMERNRSTSTSNLAFPKSSEFSGSMDNSPVHVPIRVVHSIGTLPRFRKKPPPPPPRRSSSSSGGGTYNEMHELSRSEEHINTPKPKFSTFGPSSGRNVTGGERSHSTSESSIFTMFKDVPMSAPTISGKNTKNQEIVAVNTQCSPRSSRLPLSKTSSKHNSPTRIKQTNQRQRRASSESSDSLSGSPKVRGKNYISPKIQAKQNAIASAFIRQPSVEEEEDSDLPEPNSSPVVNRSNTFTTSSTMPRPYTSPKNSPALHRHSSFSKATDKNPTPFKTFLGENASTTKTSSRVASTARKIEYGACVQTKDNGVKSVPMKVVRPMVSSSTLPRSMGSSYSGSPRSMLSTSPINVNRLQNKHDSLVRTSSKEESSSSRESTPVQSPRQSLTHGGFGREDSASFKEVTPVHSPRNSLSNTGSSSPTLLSQRRFFPARKAPAPPVPATTPEPPSTATSGNVKTLPPTPFNVVKSTDNSGSSTGGTPQQNFTKSLQQAIQQKALASASANKYLNEDRGLKHVKAATGGNSEGVKQTSNVVNGNRSSFDASQYTINPLTNNEQCDIPDEIISKHYEGPKTFDLASLDVDCLVQYLDRSISNLVPSATDSPDFRTNKDYLVAESRQFVTDSKLLVSSATQNEDKVVQNVNSSIKTLARIVYHSSKTMSSLASVQVARNLGMKVKDVALSYKTTVNSAHVAAGKALSDPNMKALMKQATGLAAILSTLMKALKALGQS